MASSKRTIDLLSTSPLQGSPALPRGCSATARCPPRHVSRELDWLGGSGAGRHPDVGCPHCVVRGTGQVSAEQGEGGPERGSKRGLRLARCPTSNPNPAHPPGKVAEGRAQVPTVAGACLVRETTVGTHTSVSPGSAGRRGGLHGVELVRGVLWSCQPRATHLGPWPQGSSPCLGCVHVCAVTHCGTPGIWVQPSPLSKTQLLFDLGLPGCLEDPMCRQATFCGHGRELGSPSGPAWNR